MKCVKKNCSCDLISLNTVRWRRLNVRRKKIKQLFREIIVKRKKIQTKKDRLLFQLKYLKNEQQSLLSSELKNLKKMIFAFFFVESNFVFSNFLIDVVLKQIIWFDLNNQWCFIFLIFFLMKLSQFRLTILKMFD